MELDPVSTGPNAARIRVAGLGGLGLVAMAGVVAWYVLEIRAALAIALVAGAILAVGLIVLRRRHAAHPSDPFTHIR